MNPDFLYASLGGALIALSAIMMMGSLGKITGISGILFRSISFSTDGRGWRLAFLVGLIIGPALVHFLGNLQYPALPNENLPLIIVAGLLVGFGTHMGSGCTSGHGICGIGRLSPRSLVATITFMVTGIMTASLINFAPI